MSKTQTRSKKQFVSLKHVLFMHVSFLCALVDVLREAGWDGRLVNESYQWVERVVAFRPPMRQWQSAVRKGLVEIGVLPYNGFTYDHIYGTKVGGTIFDQHGHRHTAADLLQYANPNGITLLLHATVHKILFKTKKGSLKLFCTYTYTPVFNTMHPP